MHILAISGLHVMLVGLTVHRLLRPLLTRIGLPWLVAEFTRTATTLVVLILYALISGASSSVVRAVTMTGFLLCGGLAKGSSNGLNAMGGAALLILSLDPLALHQAGFQLSFAAVAGLLCMGRGIDAIVRTRLGNRLLKYVLTAVSSSLVATLSTAPILMVHFGYVGLAGIFLNVAAIPVGAGVLASSLLTVTVAIVHPTLALMPGFAVDFSASVLKQMANAGASINTLILSTSATLTFGITCILLLWAFVTSNSGLSRRWILLGVVTVPALRLVVTLAAGEAKPQLDVLFLDVGHGDAALIRLPNGKSLLVDAGNRTRWRDEGKRTVLPNMEKLGVDRIDVAIISHPHADHLGGIPSLIEARSVNCVADNGQEVKSSLFRETSGLMASNRICHRTLSAGDTLRPGNDARIVVVAPPKSDAPSGPNERSVVLQLVYGTTSFLFTGDVEQHAESRIVDRYCHVIRSDVVKVPHHGSRTSSSDKFVRCVAGSKGLSTAVVSVGSHEKYGLPDEEVVERWKAVADSVHSTYEQGALWLTSDGHSVTYRTWK